MRFGATAVARRSGAPAAARRARHLDVGTAQAHRLKARTKPREIEGVVVPSALTQWLVLLWLARVHASRGQSTSLPGEALTIRQPDRTATSACLLRPKHSAHAYQGQHTSSSHTRATPHSGQCASKRGQSTVHTYKAAHPYKGSSPKSHAAQRPVRVQQGQSTVYLLTLLLLSLAPELARAATRREAAAAAESGSGACTARRAVLPPPS